MFDKKFSKFFDNLLLTFTFFRDHIYTGRHSDCDSQRTGKDLNAPGDDCHCSCASSKRTGNLGCLTDNQIASNGTTAFSNRT
ncbi:MAG TPA: hypothetical protein VF800_06905 [Telluria sp.]